MGELKALLQTYQKSLAGRKAMGLATVLRVQGSSYRQPGARMIITEEGEIVGSVSGGCLERDLILHARKSFQSPQNSTIKVLRYDTTEEGDEYESLSSVSLGCQGVVEISLEILKPGIPHLVLEALDASVHQEKSFELFTSVSSGLSSFSAPTSSSSEFLIEKITPPKRLIVFGASHDSVPLATLGKFLGWHVTVIDCHSAYKMPDRFFSGIDEYITCKPSEISSRIPLNRKSLCAVVTHNYHHDLEIIRQLLQADVGYIGLLGPKKKSETILEDLRKENPTLELPSLVRLYSPAGIDAGADDPQGIALSIITEALAVTSGREGGFLRDRRAPIHTRGLL